MGDVNLNVIAKECPQCGAVLDLKKSKCAFCNCDFFVKQITDLGNKVNRYKTFYSEILKNDNANIDAIYGLGLCFVSLELFARAKIQFDSVIQNNPENADALFYYCIALLAGRRIKTISFKEVKEIEKHLNACLIVEPNSLLFKRALAHIKYDYYVLNGLKQTHPGFEELIIESNDISQEDNEIVNKYFISNFIN
jgi:tetratricopeptide (TPR) repeat protein